MKNLSRYLIKAQEEERKKIARELHDEIGQILTAIKINLELLKRKVDKELQNQIDENINLINRAIDEVRDISLNLRPSLIDDLGLTSAIKWYVEKIKEKSNLEINYILEFNPKEFSKDFSITIFRIIQEGLTNVVRHAEATEVLLKVIQEDNEIEIFIKDDGKGFDVEQVFKDINKGRALGLLGIKERVELLDGRIEIKSEIQKGTEIRINIPLVRDI
jgi:signal transduction histidine kinase